MDIGRAFSFVFEDLEWLKKVLIGGIVSLVPIVSFAAMGYGFEETRRVYEGRELPLPEWDDFGSYFSKGLMAFIALLTYALPIIIFYCLIAFGVPILVGAGSSGSGRNAQPGPLAALAAPLSICISCLILLYVIVLVAFVPALMVRYALTEQIGAFFQFGPAWQLISTNIGGYAMALVVYLIAASIASLLGSLACLVGVYFTSFWSSLVSAYLFGTFARGALTSSMPMAPVAS